MGTPKKQNLIALSSIPLIMTLGNSMLIPILPSLRQQLHASSFQVSLIITIYSVVAILLIPLAGYLSDRYGRKKVIIPSLILTGAGGLLSGIASVWLEPAYGWILAGRFVQGIGAAGSAPIVFPLVGDLFKKESEVSSGLGLIETANTFGKVISPILGSALALWSWFAPFWAIPILCTASFFMVLFMVKEPAKKEDSSNLPTLQSFLKSVKDIFAQEGRWLYAIFALGGISMFIVFGTLFYLSEMLEDKHRIQGIWKGLVLAIPTAMLCVASYASGKLIGNDKPRMKWFTFCGILAVAVTMLLCAWLSNRSIIMDVAFISLSLVGVGAALPCLDALITEGIEKKLRGTVTSIYSSMRFIGVAAGPPIASIMIKQSPAPFFYLSASLGIISLALTAFAIKPDEEQKAVLKAKPQ